MFKLPIILNNLSLFKHHSRSRSSEHHHPVSSYQSPHPLTQTQHGWWIVKWNRNTNGNEWNKTCCVLPTNNHTCLELFEQSHPLSPHTQTSRCSWFTLHLNNPSNYHVDIPLSPTHWLSSNNPWIVILGNTLTQTPPSPMSQITHSKSWNCDKKSERMDV